MVDRDMGEVVQPSDEQEGTSPLLNRASMDENEEQMTSHSSMVVDDMLTLKIRVSSDGRTFSLPTRRSNSIESLKADIIRVIGAHGKDIRVIAAGKPLIPDSELIGNFKLADQSFVHCVVTNPRPRTETRSVQSIEEGLCGNAAADEVDSEANTDPSQWRGLDRLRVHLNVEQISAIHSYFSPQVREMTSASSTVGNESTDEEEGRTDWDRQMDAEERWMATQGESSEFAMNTLTSGPFSDYTSRRLLLNVLESGDQQEILSFFTPYSQLESIRDFLIGLTLGYFLRYIMLLVCLVEGSARARFKLGIVCGVILHASQLVITAITEDEKK